MGSCCNSRSRYCLLFETGTVEDFGKLGDHERYQRLVVGEDRGELEDSGKLEVPYTLEDPEMFQIFGAVDLGKLEAAQALQQPEVQS